MNYPKTEPILAAFIESDRCPECDDGNFVHPVKDEETYVDDEDCMSTTMNGKPLGPRFWPYKLWHCDNCGAEFRVYLGPVEIEITKERDCE